MDPLRRDDIERARRTPLEERARQVIAVVDEGIRLKRIALRTRYPEASERDIDERLRRWLLTP